MTSDKKIRALGLCSGGLDSILSGLILREQGIDAKWITFETPFFSAAKARKASNMTGIPLVVKHITPVYMEMLKNPPCGYGKYMNPCMDCHALMFRLAGAEMEKNGFDLLFSGEVLGQRPMSQTRTSLRYVEKHSGFDGYILRPLSAKRLPETIPEKEGLVDRERLLDITGRSRKPQIRLAERFGVTDYPAPAGGCLLTDKIFSKRLKDLFDHQETQTENELHLLKFGRHFRIDENTKIIVGRTANDNKMILKYHAPETDIVLKMVKFPGPIVLVPGNADPDIVRKAAGICAGYGKAPNDMAVEVGATTGNGREIIRTKGIDPDEMREKII